MSKKQAKQQRALGDSRKRVKPRQKKHVIAKVRRSVKRPVVKQQSRKHENKRSGKKARDMHKKKLESAKRRLISNAKAKVPKPQLV